MTPIEMTAGQQGIWVQDSLGAGAAYHVPFAYRLGDGLDMERLVGALEDVLGAHAALRTRFRLVEGELMAEVSPLGTGVRVEQHSVEVADVQDALTDSWEAPFDLAIDLPVRVLLLDVGDHHILSVTVHHVVFDDWSMGLLLDELTERYRDGPDATPASDDAILSAHLAGWRAEIEASGPVRERTLRRLTADFSDTPERLDLPRHQGAAGLGGEVRGASQRTFVDPVTAAAVRELAAEHGCTEFVVYLAAWTTLISIHGQHEDVAIGTPFAQRSRPGAEGLVGYFLDSLVVRQQIKGTDTFGEVIDATRDAFFAGVEQSALVAYEDVAREITGRDPSAQLFAAWFAWQRGDDDFRLDDVEVERLEVPTTTAKFDLSLFVTHDPVQPRLDLEYPVSYFDQGKAQMILRHYVRLLDMVTVHPGRGLANIDLLNEGESRDLERWERGPAAGSPPTFAYLDDAIIAEAETHPGRTALLQGDVATSYAALIRRARQWTAALRAEGVLAGEVVGVAVGRSTEMLAALLGVVGAGAAYVALDPLHPVERLRYMIMDSDVRHAVADTSEALPSVLGMRLLVSADVDNADVPMSFVTRPPAASALAYVTYTSGSTGRPKGIRMTHQAVMNLLVWQRSAYPEIGLGARTLQFASLGFDVSAQEIFGTLQTGGTLVLISQDQRDAVHDIMRIVSDARIQRLFLPAPALLEAVESAVALNVTPHDLRVVISGSEQLVVTEALRTFFMSAATSARLFNEYGPSETHVATMYAAGPNPAAWPTWMPIGSPIGATELRLLDAHGRRIPPGSVGEIYLSGPGLAQGYADMSAATARAFAPDSHSKVPGERTYRTGDLARYSSDGSLEYLGRRDSQVKVRGFRIELEEIRSVLDAAGDVAQAFVSVVGRPGRTEIVGYWRRHPGSDITEASLRAFLAARLPDYMLPAELYEVEQFPLSANGKVDERKLAAVRQAETDAPSQKMPQECDPLIAAVSKTMARVLERPHVGFTEDFFTVGGNSLLANRLVWSLSADGIAQVSLRSVMQGRTPTRIAAASEPIAPPNARRSKKAVPTQQRLKNLIDSLEE